MASDPHKRGQQEPKCVFCRFADPEVIVWEDELCYAAISEDPINQHHMLVIPRTHYLSFVEVPSDVAGHLIRVTQKLSAALRRACRPDGITHIFDDDVTGTGWNLVAHFKIHVIPRYQADLHQIDWAPLRSSAGTQERARYAADIREQVATLAVTK